MADNVELNAGSGGATVLTDDCTTGHAQIVKLAIATDGSATLIPSDGTNGLTVNLGTNNDVTVTGSLTSAGAVTNAGTFAVQEDGAALTALQLVDDVVYVDDADWTDNTSKHALVGGLYQSTPQTVTDGDVAPFNITANGAMHVAVQNTVTVGSHAVTNAGTFATQVDGDALTALQLIDDPVATLGTTTYTEAATKGMIVGAVRRDADTTLVDTTNEVGPLQMNAAGQLKVEVFSGEALPVTLTSTTVTGTVAVTQSGTWDEVGINDSGNSITVDWAGTAPPIGAGVEATALRVTLATDSTGVVSVDDNGSALTVDNGGTFAVQVDGAALTALQLIDNPVLVDDAAFTPATSSVMMAGFQADEASIDSVNEGDAGAARMTLDRKVIVTPQPHSAGGLSIFRSIDLDESEEEVSATACCVYSVWVTNTATSTRFLKFYNLTAANTSVGSSTPVITIGIPGNSSDDIAGSFTGGGYGITFDTALSVAATTGVADADTGAPGANEVIVNIFYKA